MKKRRPWRNRTLAFWLSIESVVVTLVTVAPFAMLHILAPGIHGLGARNSRGDGAGGGDHRHAVQPPIQPNGVRPDPGLKGSGRRGFFPVSGARGGRPPPACL